MKKVLYVILIMFIVYPVAVYGEGFNVPETDIILDIDEEVWTVFTREDVANEEIMNNYELNQSDMKDFFESNSIYLDGNAKLDGENVTEIMVKKIKNEDGIVDLDRLKDNELTVFTEKFYTSNNLDNYDIYTNQNGKYIYYKFSGEDIYGVEYYTIVNGDDYYITFISDVSLNDELTDTFDYVVDGITFNYKNEKTKNISTTTKTVFFVSFGLIVLAIMMARKYSK